MWQRQKVEKVPLSSSRTININKNLKKVNEELQQVIYPEIQQELAEMGKEDQAGLQASPFDQAAFSIIAQRNTERMKKIIEQIGWPTISKVGKDGNRGAWFLAQHSDRDRDFQRKCLALMKSQPQGEVDPGNIAYLEDRVLVAEGKPQKYGTQLDWQEEGVIITIKPVEDPENLNKRRAEVGFNSIEEYLGDAARLRGIEYKLPY